MSRRITDETKPSADRVRIGIEIEGVGTIRTRWDKPTVVEQDNFHDVFKRMPLVRSGSFSGSRGVYITPEDADTFGTQSPAELVSSPHLLTVKSLIMLRNSVWKALSNQGVRTGSATFSDPRLSATANTFQGSTATSRWGINRLTTIGGSLQTTIGVCVHNILSDDLSTRNAVADLLIGDATKKGYLKDLTAASIACADYLTAQGMPLFHYRAQKFGIRFAVLMFLINILAADMAGEGRWAKEALGCNFKGSSSWIGCGVAASNGILKLGRAGTGHSPADLENGMIAAIGNNWVSQTLAAKTAVEFCADDLGKPGLALQTAVEGWFGLGNFNWASKLYTVVEAREKEAGLNKKMVTFLNAKKRVVLTTDRESVTQATTLYSTVSVVIGL